MADSRPSTRRMPYAAIGDGGRWRCSNAQNFGVYLGGMIRLDVDHGDPYKVPDDNHCWAVGQAAWALGERTAQSLAVCFRCAERLLFIADVGQGLHEEVDAVPMNRG